MKRFVGILLGLAVGLGLILLGLIQIGAPLDRPFGSAPVARQPATDAGGGLFERAKTRVQIEARAMDTEEQALAQKLTSSMRSAKYAFNHPEVMYLTKRYQITLVLAADESRALA